MTGRTTGCLLHALPCAAAFDEAILPSTIRLRSLPEASWSGLSLRDTVGPRRHRRRHGAIHPPWSTPGRRGRSNGRVR